VRTDSYSQPFSPLAGPNLCGVLVRVSYLAFLLIYLSFLLSLFFFILIYILLCSRAPITDRFCILT